MDIPIPQSNSDIYAYGFDKNLNRVLVVTKESNPVLYDSITDQVNAGLITSGGLSGVMPLVEGDLQSGNFVTGVAGWQLTPTSAEFPMITVSGGTVRYGKASFVDTGTGYIISPLGIYFGGNADATKMKFNIADGTLDLVGTVSGRATAILASAIDASGTLTTNLVNAQLDTNSKKMLSDFNFGTTDYSGALKAGSITWSSVTGALTGGTGVAVFRKGIIGSAHGSAMFALDAETGDATFAGALVAATGSFAGTLSANNGALGNITGGTITGITITGGLIQTESAATAGVKMTPTGFAAYGGDVVYFYDSNNNFCGQIYGFTQNTLFIQAGNVIVSGNLGYDGWSAERNLGSASYPWANGFIATAAINHYVPGQTTADFKFNLLPATAGSFNIGSSAMPWLNAIFSTTSGKITVKETDFNTLDCDQITLNQEPGTGTFVCNKYITMNLYGTQIMIPCKWT